MVESNEAVLKLLFRSQVDANELTGEQYPNVKLIDFEHPERNQFHAVNQFRIDTPGATKGFNVNFHWKCMMSPAKVLDYIVVHELAHLIHPDHSAKFWNEVDKLLPDFAERKEWPRVHGAGMDL